ncbi:MAG: 30S ribosomal protein S8 [Chlamydiales bacterium]|nr:30S ribosomal protein S8 [Chlamydiales bacterium]
MATSDPIADLLTRMRNACGAGHRYVDVPLSKMHLAIIDVIKQTGFVENFIFSEEKRKIRIFLKFAKNRKPIIRGIVRISKPGVRKYVGAHEIPKIMEGLGITILSTPKGVVSGDRARSLHVGGELLCKIW